jgi:hypothetical protein
VKREGKEEKRKRKDGGKKYKEKRNIGIEKEKKEELHKHR